MTQYSREELLGIPELVDEIRRHQWIESEKAGHDLGFDWACDDWISKYSQVWLDYHRPNHTLKKLIRKPSRSAKSYFL